MEKKQVSAKYKMLGVFKKPLFSSFLIIAILVGAIIGLSETIESEKARMIAEKKGAIAREQPLANVVLLNINPNTIQDRINLPGVIEPWEKLDVSSKVHGTVTEVPVREGDKITEGQVIALLDSADFQIANDSAKATYELAAKNQKRMMRLYKKGITPEAEIDKLNAEVKTSRAVLKNTELMLSRCTITAPISGIIRRLDATQGLLLDVGDPVAEILQIDKVKAVVGIPESDVDQVRSITDVTVTIQALNDKKVTGRSHFLASSPENGARLYRFELAIDNKTNRILPGMFLRAEIVKKTIKNAAVVPLYTIIKRNDRQFVYVEENGMAQLASVELGIIEDWRVHVTKGLSLGSRVVVEGHREINEGNKLNIVRVLNDPLETLL